MIADDHAGIAPFASLPPVEIRCSCDTCDRNLGVF